MAHMRSAKLPPAPLGRGKHKPKPPLSVQVRSEQPAVEDTHDSQVQWGAEEGLSVGDVVRAECEHTKY